MTSFKCKACGDHWTEGVTGDHREDQECRNCSRGRAEILTAFYKSAMDRAEAAERTIKSLSEELEAEVVETDALKVRLVDAAKEINALRVQVANLESQVAAASEPWHVQSAMLNSVTTERDRYRETLKSVFDAFHAGTPNSAIAIAIHQALKG